MTNAANETNELARFDFGSARETSVVANLIPFKGPNSETRYERLSDTARALHDELVRMDSAFDGCPYTEMLHYWNTHCYTLSVWIGAVIRWCDILTNAKYYHSPFRTQPNLITNRAIIEVATYLMLQQ